MPQSEDAGAADGASSDEYKAAIVSNVRSRSPTPVRQSEDMGAADGASSDDHEDTAASLRRISSNYDEYQERRGALEDATEGRLTDVSTCLRERYEPWMAMNSREYRSVAQTAVLT